MLSHEKIVEGCGCRYKPEGVYDFFCTIQPDVSKSNNMIKKCTAKEKPFTCPFMYWAAATGNNHFQQELERWITRDQGKSPE